MGRWVPAQSYGCLIKTSSAALEPLRVAAKVVDSTTFATQAREPALLVSLLIGTNNLGHGHSPEATGQGVLAVARSLLSLTRGKLLINALLPRGDRSMCICMCMPHCVCMGCRRAASAA